jgi:hypothetical protein
MIGGLQVQTRFSVRGRWKQLAELRMLTGGDIPELFLY